MNKLRELQESFTKRTKVPDLHKAAAAGDLSRIRMLTQVSGYVIMCVMSCRLEDSIQQWELLKW
jgi:hypothetical protein